MKDLVIAGKSFPSRLLLGTGKFASSALMSAAIAESGTAMVTVALKRVEMDNPQDDILSHIDTQKVSLLPNTSGVRNAKEAVFAAQLAREALGTNWLKLEIHPDPRYLMPDPIEVLKATEELAKDGFVIMPYIHADPVLCKRLEEAGAACVMPLGAPIGSNKGLASRDFLRIIIEQSNVPVVVDARNRRAVACRRSARNGRRRRAGQHRDRRGAGPRGDGPRLPPGRRGGPYRIRSETRAGQQRRTRHQPDPAAAGRRAEFEIAGNSRRNLPV